MLKQLYCAVSFRAQCVSGHETFMSCVVTKWLPFSLAFSFLGRNCVQEDNGVILVCEDGKCVLLVYMVCSIMIAFVMVMNIAVRQ